MQSKTPKSTSVLVLGMHRSGTSAVTRFLNLLGVDLPDQLLDAVPGNNDSGFWESREVQSINDSLLEALDSRWDDWQHLHLNVADVGLDQIQSFIKAQFQNSSLFSIKDPRICRLVPIWHRALVAEEKQVVAVVPFRSPHEVAASLQHRDGFSEQKSLLLWLRHVLDAERSTRHLRIARVFVPYEGLLEDWQRWAERIASTLEIQWPIAIEIAERPITSFLNPTQRHHVAKQSRASALQPVSGWAIEAYRCLLALSDDPKHTKSFETLDRIFDEFDALSRVFGPPFSDEIRRFHADRRNWISHTKGVEDRLAERVQRLEYVETLAQQRKIALQERSDKVTQLERLATERNLALQERASKIVQLESLASQRKQLLDDRVNRIYELEQIAANRKNDLENRIEKVAALESRLADRKQQLKVVKDQLEKSERERLYLERKLSLDELVSRSQAVQLKLASLPLGVPPKLAFGQSLSLNQRRRAFRQARMLIKHGLFDARWYLLAHPDLMQLRQHPIWHWMLIGCSEGRRPNVLFDPVWYLRQCPDVKAIGLNPLIHYLEHGAAEGRHPGPLFDANWYTARYPDVGASDLPALQHYLNHGRSELRQAFDLFDPVWYLEKNPDVRGSSLDPLEHFLLVGGREKRDPSPSFAGTWYLEQHPDVARAKLNPLQHYLEHGRLEQRPRRPQDVSTLSPAPPRNIGAGFPTYPGKNTPVEGCANVLICAHAANGQLFGGERSFLDILALLEQLPYNVFVVIPAVNPDYIEQLRPLCCEITQISYGYWRDGLEPDHEAQRRLKAFMISRQIHLVHVNTIVIREPLRAARELGIPSAVHVRESVHDDAWISRMMGLSPETLVDQVTDSADVIIANSRHTAHEFHKPERCFVVPNTFDMEELDMPNEFERTRIRVGLISSNIPKKGLEDFVQLAKACAPQLPSYEFLLIGPDNEHTQALKKRQSKGELSDNLSFVGYQASPRAAIALCNVVLNLSHFKESFGRTIAEALAARRPVIVYAHGAPQDLVSPGKSGHIIEFKRWDQAIPLLKYWSENPDELLRMGESGRRFINAKFSRSAGIEALRRAYNAAMNTMAPRFPLVLPARRPPRLVAANAPLKLAYFCWHFPVPSETFVLNELRLLVAQGVDVQVFCKQSPFPEFQPDFEIQWTRIKDVEDLSQQLRSTQRSLVHAHFTYPTVTEMVWPACERSGIPFTFIAHAQDIFKHENDRKNRVGELTRSESCLAVFTLGRYHRDFLLERGVPSEKLIINPNGIDPSLFPFEQRTGRSDVSRKRVCAIHRLTEKKGLRYLIEAARLLEGEGFEINIYGYGEEEESLRELLATPRLDSVVLRGPLKTREEIIAVLRSHDLFACPSVRTESGDMDGIPTVLIESMAAGTPVITTHVASIPDLVQDGVTGNVVEPGDANALAEGLRRFFTLDAEQVQGMVFNARAAVEERHDARKLTARLQRFWQRTSVDIVIVSWNNLPELSAVISHLYAHTKSHFHLIICDNASAPDVTDFLLDLQIRRNNVTVIHKGHNSLVGPGTNAAIEQGDSDYIIYVCGKEGFALTDGWETDMIAWMDQNPSTGMAGSLGYSPTYLSGRDLEKGIPLFGQFRNREFASQNPNRIFRHVQGGLFILRRQTFEEIGGFSESVPHAYTDVEYSFYLESCGWQLGCIPSVLALFNKTVPDIWSRLHEGVKAIHPPRIIDLPKLHAITERKTHLCNCCGWTGPQFSASDNCPQCGSAPRHRGLYRHLAEGTLTYRRLPALWINPHRCLSPFWTRSFQGRTLNHSDLQQEIDQQGRIDTASSRLALIVLDAADMSIEQTIGLFSELHRTLSPEGELVFLPGKNTPLNLLLPHLQKAGLTKVQENRYVSSVVRYALNAIHTFEKTPAEI